jgi:UPF0716 protein FxsA
MPLLAIPLTFLGLVVLELWILFQLSDAIGFFETLLLVFSAGIIGAWIAKWQGLYAILRVQNELRQGVVPTRTIGDGALILVAGILLLLPGVISDVLGIALLIPPIRHLVMFGIRNWFSKNVRVQTTAFWPAGSGKFPGDDTVRGSSTIVDAKVIESHVVEEDARTP